MIRMLFASLAIVAFSWGSVSAQDARTKSPAGAAVYFISPADGATVSGTVTVKFGLSGMGVAPAGIEKAKTGHHHLLINQKLADYNASIPSDATHKHFGGGQTETTVTLAPGKHRLQLVVGDHNHIPHNPPVQSGVIEITVR